MGFDGFRRCFIVFGTFLTFESILWSGRNDFVELDCVGIRGPLDGTGMLVWLFKGSSSNIWKGFFFGGLLVIFFSATSGGMVCVGRDFKVFPSVNENSTWEIFSQLPTCTATDEDVFNSIWRLKLCPPMIERLDGNISEKSELSEISFWSFSEAESSEMLSTKRRIDFRFKSNRLFRSGVSNSRSHFSTFFRPLFDIPKNE